MQSSFFAWLALLVGAYITLLWWTADAHQPMPASTKIQPVASPDEFGTTVAALEESSKVGDQRAAIAPMEPIDTSPTDTDIELEEAPPEGPAIQSQPASKPIAHWITTLQTSSDRTSRKEALDALLRIGRHSTVDQRIVAALREAASDLDPQIASAANSALAEVERPTH
jgi:hypothetical protein